METATRRYSTDHYWNLVKGMDDSQKLELVTMLIDSVKPAVRRVECDDEEYNLTPFTMKELNARVDKAEAEIVAGKVIDHEDLWRELEEEFAKELIRFPNTSNNVEEVNSPRSLLNINYYG